MVEECVGGRPAPFDGRSGYPRFTKLDREPLVVTNSGKQLCFAWVGASKRGALSSKSADGSKIASQKACPVSFFAMLRKADSLTATGKDAVRHSCVSFLKYNDNQADHDRRRSPTKLHAVRIVHSGPYYTRSQKVSASAAA